jgi:hypothetical protein
MVLARSNHRKIWEAVVIEVSRRKAGGILYWSRKYLRRLELNSRLPFYGRSHTRLYTE